MTSEERIEKVSQLLMEGMTDEKKSKENYLKIAQLEVDNIVSVINNTVFSCRNKFYSFCT